MKTLVVSKSSSDPIAVRVCGLLQANAEGAQPSTLSYAGLAKDGIREPVDLAMLVLTSDVDEGLEICAGCGRPSRDMWWPLGRPAIPR